MVSHNKLAIKNSLEDGEYLITDPVILDNMLFAMDIKAPDTGAVLITKKTIITPKLLKHLKKQKLQMRMIPYLIYLILYLKERSI